ncbi:ornithine cyclodeaminase family protein [Microbacterium sp. ASV49]|uniref:Ornithine cyclodeaminase family protein n=1 Tax=Microbacterium candidum TaxID=3041922 RepID=A0ABT7MZY0_9MICO|nr:ornithine cyclodeaminase family protein [Microbacterium sp. ASV49]MDL9979980.1 ornithine cyclodeaminase family protein [Microbacterium sp. ASV49]
MTEILSALTTVDAASLRRRLSMGRAIRALQETLEGGFDPQDDSPRTIVDVDAGQLLLMPGRVGPLVGQKLATVAPGNPGRGLDRIQGLYILIDGETLTPTALIDGTELTALRTPAVSAAVADVVAAPDAMRLVVFGTGPQGVRHVGAMRAIRPIEHVRFVGRDPERAARAVADASAPGLDVAVGSPDELVEADIVVCATTARTPVASFDALADRAVVVAVGSHEPDARELPADLLGRSHVIVESRAVARTEAGDVIQAIAEGPLTDAELFTFHDVFGGRIPPSDRPRVIKTCGMGWQDLVVAHAAMRREDEGAR